MTGAERQSKDFPLNYRDNGGGLYIRRWVGHGATRTVVFLVLPDPDVVSQEFA